MHKLVRSIAVLILLLGSFTSVHAQAADLITGRVTDEAGQPVAGARVEAMSIETEITRTVITDRSGRFMINFPDGGGRYLLRITFLGKADVVRTVLRQGEEELLVANITMADQAIAIDAVTAVARRPQPSSGRTGEQSTDLPQELLTRLPLSDLDPNTLAQLAAGVVAADADSLSGTAGFSVAGMSELLNQIVLDGTILGDNSLQVPEEGIRRTSVTTSTFDAARGGFAGGQVQMTTARGNNRAAGALTYRLDNDAFQLGSASTVNAYSRQHVSGAMGGPIVRNKLFYNIAFGLQRNVNHRFALSADDEVSALRAGVARDSIARFIGVLGGYGLPVNTVGRYDQLRDNLSLQLRTDWNMMQRENQQHTLSVRLNGSRSNEDSTRISTLDLAQHGGEVEGDNWAAAMSLNSRLGTRWTNALSVSLSESWNESLPFVEMPEGRVLVTSDFADASRATQTLVFGGNRSMPTDAYRRGFQLSNDFSFLLPAGNQLHRLKVGATVQRTRNVTRSSDNLLGSFYFNSLDDLENNRPARFERTLTERASRFGTTVFGLYIGDTWRWSEKLELTGGLRWDRTRVREAPAYNPLVEEVFGRRTDIEPVASSISPRIGFNYRLASADAGRSPKTLTGGIGLFAGQTPTHIFVNAARQTGLSDAEQRLICIGDATPIPDWDAYFNDPTSVPDTCADGGTGEDVYSLRAPTVSLINPEQRMPASLRAEIGYQTRLPFNINANFRYSFARGMGLWGYYDINLDENTSVVLAEEQRPYFGDVAAIVPATGQTTLAASRIDNRFGNVFDVRADRASTAHQFIAQVNGMLPKGFTVATNYTLSFARDEGIDGTFRAVTTASSPNRVEWAASSNDRRHTLNFIVAKAITPEIEITAMTRLSSGTPFTPMVARDVNGDGMSNDRAFIFDPNTVDDPALAEGMTRVLASVPDRIADCLREQFGTIADRNSCRNGWSRSLDMRASLRPNLPRVQRRLTFSIDANNVLNGMDQLFNGNDLKGWGESPRVDTRLLEVRGFDPNTNRFIYQVNEGFGQNRRGNSAIRSPFALRFTARLAVGGMPFQNNRAFGAPPGMGAPGGRFGGGARGPGGSAMRGGNVEGMVDRLLTNPVQRLLEMKDTLELTAEQVTRVQAIADSLQLKLDAQRDTLNKRIEGAAPQQRQQLFGELQLIIEKLGQDMQAAMAAVQQVLTPEQWQRVPERVRMPFRRGERGRRE